MLPDEYDVLSIIPEATKQFFCGKKVLVTGGLGMIGSNLSRTLVSMGADVTILDAMLPLYGGNKANIFGVDDKLNLVIADIRDKEVMERLVSQNEVVFHLAGQVSYIDSMTDPLLDLDINCKGTLVLLECCRHLNPKAKIVFAGSRMQYGRIAYNPVDEQHPTEPLMMYGVHKLTSEKYHMMYYHDFGIPTTVLRIANPFGPRQQMKHSKYGIINWFIRLAMTDQTIKIFGDGMQLRDYIYVMDIVSAMLMTGADPAANGKVFNVGSGKGTHFIDMANEVVKVVGKGRIETVPWPPNYENIETGSFIANVSRIYESVGWQAKYNLTTGIRKTYEYYKLNREHYWE